MSEDPIKSVNGANPLLDEAIGWCLRMNGPDAPLHQVEFEAWLALGGVHRQVYSEVSELYGFGERLRGMSIARDVQPPVNAPTPLRRSRWKMPALAALVVIGTGLGAFFVHGGIQGPLGGAPVEARGMARGQVQTGLGEIRSVGLADGSTLILDTDSLVTLDVIGAERRAHVERGRVRFSIAPDRRPFNVMAGPGTLSAPEAVFDVNLARDEGVDVSLVRGAVLLQPAASEWTKRPVLETRVAMGFSASFGPARSLTIRRAGRMDLLARAWPSGLVAFEGAPLSQVVKEANRYAVTRIILSDPMLGDRPFYGTVRIRDTRGLAGLLAHAFSLRVVERDGVLHLSS